MKIYNQLKTNLCCYTFYYCY